MSDLSLLVKTTTLSILDTSTALTALVPATSINPMTTPALPEYPFLRYEMMSSEPYEDSCGSGSSVDVRIHVFVASEYTCHQICAAVSSALNNAVNFMICDWVRTQIVPDPAGADVWHGMVDFNIVMTQ